MASNLSNTPSRRPATSADVAQRAGVSRATVSYILNSTPGVKFADSTRRAVLRAADELEYRPNAAARSLAAGSSIVVIVVPHLPQSDFTARIGERLTSRLAQRGMLSTLVHESRDEDALVDTITTFRPRAAVFFAPPSPAIASRLEDAGVKIITPLIDPEPPAAITSLQVQHLVGKGRRKLAFATVDHEQAATISREQELVAACESLGLPAPLSGRFRLDGEGASETVRQWHQQGVDAVCAYNDDVALAVLFGIREAGLTCPDHLAVIGSDGITAGATAYPPLTTIAIDPEPAADWFVTHLLTRLDIEEAKSAAPADTILHLVIRRSV